MNERTQRRLSGVVGVFLLLAVAAGTALLGSALVREPVLLTQVTLLALAGLADGIAAVDSPLTDRLAWYRWNGLGYLLLGLSLPFGFVEMGGIEGVALFATTVAGGLSLVGMGVDLVAFHGKYTRTERLDA